MNAEMKRHPVTSERTLQAADVNIKLAEREDQFKNLCPDLGVVPVSGRRAGRLLAAHRRLAMRHGVKVQLVLDALSMAVTQRPPASVIQHSDSQKIIASFRAA